MAVENRSDLKLTISTNLPDNITEDITPEKHREVEDNIADSHFNQLDEPRDVIKSVVYVSKNGNDLTAKEGDQSSPYLTIQAAADAMPEVNGVLKVLGGGTYTENVQLDSASVNCVFDFGNCTINGDFRAQFAPATNGCLVTNLNISGSTILDIRSTFLSNIRSNTSVTLICLSKLISNCFITSSSGTSALRTQGLNESKYYDTCTIVNTGTGNAVDRSSYTIFNNCFVESNTGDALNNETNADTIQETIRIFNSSVKSAGFCLDGENGRTNLLAFNTKFYSSASNVINQGGTQFGLFLQFEGCEFYTNGANDVFVMNGAGIINRTNVQNYTFKNCVFHTDTGFPIQEPPSYNGADAGTTLLVNCVYNAATATSGGAVKVTEHNSFQFTNYTNFNPLI